MSDTHLLGYLFAAILGAAGYLLTRHVHFELVELGDDRPGAFRLDEEFAEALLSFSTSEHSPQNLGITYSGIPVRMRLLTGSVILGVIATGTLWLILLVTDWSLVRLFTVLGIKGGVVLGAIWVVSSLVADRYLWRSIIEELAFQQHQQRWTTSKESGATTSEEDVGERLQALSERRRNFRTQYRQQVEEALPGKAGIAAYMVLLFMWAVSLVQSLLVGQMSDPERVFGLFVLRTDHLAYYWTWVTSIFAHVGFGHLVTNSVALAFVGPAVEEALGTRRFVILFAMGGVLGGLGQVVYSSAIDPDAVVGVLGSSAAILALLGSIVVLQPRLEVLVFFLRMPLWVFVLLFGAATMLFLVVPDVSARMGQASAGHMGHLVGLLIGLIVGFAWRNSAELNDARDF